MNPDPISGLSPAVIPPSNIATGLSSPAGSIIHSVANEQMAKAASAASASDSPSVEQKLFLVVSVALATVCFFTNAVQVCVFLRPSCMRSVRNLLLLSQAISGLVASSIVAFPIHSIALKGSSGSSSGSGTEGFNACYLGHSAVILVSVLTSLSTATLLLFHHYLTHNNPRRYLSAGMNLLYWGAAATGTWAFAFSIAALPWAGWNSWATHDAHCHLSTLWPLSFTAFLSFVVGGHMAVALFMWANSRREDQKAAAATGAQGEAEGVPIGPPMRSSLSSGKVVILSFLTSAFTCMPIVFHVLLASSCNASAACRNNPRHYHEDEAGLPWVSLLLTAAGIAKPLLYVFSDDQVSTITLLLLSRLCCFWRSSTTTRDHRSAQQTPANKPSAVPPPHHHESVTNVYISNDTENLMGE